MHDGRRMGEIPWPPGPVPIRPPSFPARPGSSAADPDKLVSHPVPVWSADAGNRRVQLAPKVSLFQNPCHGTPHCYPGRGWLAIDRMSVSLAPPAPAA